MVVAGAIQRMHSLDGGIRHTVAPSKALGMIYRVVSPALYRRICMAIEIASDLHAFFVVLNLLLPIMIAK